MRFKDDPEVALWLGSLVGASEAFDWDVGNQRKSLEKHGVGDANIESLLDHPILFEGCIVEPAHPEKRWLLLGQDGTGRPLALVFTRRGDKLRPISCRPMRKKEKACYEKALKENEEGDGRKKI